MRRVAWAWAALLAAGCSVHADSGCDHRAGEGTLRQRLNPGYALMYQEFDGLPKLHWLLMLKKESHAESRLVDDALEFWRGEARELEVLARKHPELQLSASPLPDVIGRAREKQGKDQTHDFRPLSGEHGAPFERDLLLMLRGAVDEQRHLAWEIQSEETEADLKKFLSRGHERLDTLYDRFDRLLKEHYFA